jgi:uncharacterized protein (TIGR02001 family)
VHRLALRPALSAFVSTCLPACLLGWMAAASAQGLPWSGSVWLESDRFYRGVSQTQGHASAGLGLNLDHHSGAYGGLAVAAVELVPGPRRAQTLLYGGFARRFGDGPLGWDLGLQAVRFQDHANRNYLEAYAGLGGTDWSLRLHWSPDYYGMGRAAQYLAWQQGGALPFPRWRWLLRAGVLHWPRELPGQRRWRADGQAGIAFDLGRFTLEAAAVAAQRSQSLYPSAYESRYGTSSNTARVHGLLRLSAGF